MGGIDRTMQITFDNIIFSLQRFGGVSVVWQELLRRACSDKELTIQLLDYPNANSNRTYIDFQSSHCLELPMRWMERYRTPEWKPTEETIFHSSYFRICPLPLVNNITTIHDLTYHFYRKGPAKWIHLWEEERALRHSCRILCVSKNTKNDLMRLYPWLKEEHVHVVYNGVSDLFHPDSSVKKQGYLLYVGNRTVDYKRFDVAVEVAHETGLELMALGHPITDKERQMLDSTIPNRYRIITGFTHQQLNRYYNEALCLLYPSDYEGFGLPVLEAQKAGCPVIAQNASAIPEIIGDGWMVQPNPPKKMAIEISNLVRQILSGNPYPIAACQSNASKFTWDNSYTKTKELYLSIER